MRFGKKIVQINKHDCSRASRAHIVYLYDFRRWLCPNGRNEQPRKFTNSGPIGEARYNLWLGKISQNVKIEDIYLQQAGNKDQKKWWDVNKCEEHLKADVVSGSHSCFSEERPYYVFSNLCGEDEAEITAYKLQGWSKDWALGCVIPHHGLLWPSRRVRAA